MSAEALVKSEEKISQIEQISKDQKTENGINKYIEHQRVRVYTMFYRHGSNPQCTKNFEFIGNFREAVDRARKHCEVMNYRFILLRPLISDLELDEQNRANGINS